ncbi:hypothetical protein AVEN_267810-1 [Araneus ventricosus]|uniref:Uncharacterized protein n=1 Tax=Araneus ventricosus TaxID=182803 RepID=A0A4Y2D5K0_ARAVE|nr:hypothetical protein AVEN_267810-1 [Araneus ventricosus]
MEKSKRMTPTSPHPVLFLDEHFQIRTNRNKGELLSRGILYVGRSFTIMKGYLSPIHAFAVFRFCIGIAIESWSSGYGLVLTGLITYTVIKG